MLSPENKQRLNEALIASIEIGVTLGLLLIFVCLLVITFGS